MLLQWKYYYYNVFITMPLMKIISGSSKISSKWDLKSCLVILVKYRLFYHDKLGAVKNLKTNILINTDLYDYNGLLQRCLIFFLVCFLCISFFLFVVLSHFILFFKNLKLRYFLDSRSLLEQRLTETLNKLLIYVFYCMK